MLTQIIILSTPYIWHLFLICIHKGPSSPHICRLLSPHLWYQYLEIEKWCTLCCARLLVPSRLKYPLLELGQFVLQFIFKFFYSYWLSLQEWMGKVEPYVLKINLEWEGTCIHKYLQQIFYLIFLGTIMIFFFKIIIIINLVKKIVRKETFWVMFTWCLFLVIVDK
jgi:hypothetical protein